MNLNLDARVSSRMNSNQDARVSRMDQTRMRA